MMGAYLRRNRDEGYFDVACTAGLAISSLFNWITAFRVGFARRRLRMDQGLGPGRVDGMTVRSMYTFGSKA
jgi:hypothetical protein